MKTDYYSMIHSDILTERQILTVKNALNSGRFQEMNIWPCRPITEEQTCKGLQWLRKNQNRKCCCDLVPADKWVIEHFSLFTFDGFHQHGRFFVPIYTVHASDGHWFAYIYDFNGLKVLGRG